MVSLLLYQVSLHRFEVRMERIRPPEQRAVRDKLAFSRWCDVTASIPV